LQKLTPNIGFEEKRHLLSRKLAKIEENCDRKSTTPDFRTSQVFSAQQNGAHLIALLRHEALLRVENVQNCQILTRVRKIRAGRQAGRSACKKKT
jgi:hypothetical protein